MSKPILYYSTNLTANPVPFNEALLKGLAPDKGLFMPEIIPSFSHDEIKALKNKAYYEVAFEVCRKFMSGILSDDELLTMVKNAYDFPIPLEHVYENKYVIRLDQGPTASFKDFAGRMMGQWMQFFLKKDNKKLLILTATSGDTGSAIANAFYGLENIKVVVLFPEKEVTPRQRKQMTTLGKNVKIIAIDTKFDDAQALVKEAFSDPDLNYLPLSSANSINIGRLIPQIVYYFYSFAQLSKGTKDESVVFSVPSGNFGDMMGGVLAMKMGLPVKRFVISTNKNEEFPKYLATGKYQKIEPSVNCISSAMNVGHPSNLARLVALYGGVMDEQGNISKAANMELMKKEIFSVSIDDQKTKDTIKDAWSNHKLLLEPHGSVGWAGLMNYLELHPEPKDQLCISLETAHPAKFPEQINKIIGIDPELPESLKGLELKEEHFDLLKSNYADFKSYLIKNYN